MPIHDWNRATSGYFHHFHQCWSGSICDALNGGVLPKGYFALIEQCDMARTNRNMRSGPNVAKAAPQTWLVTRAGEGTVYAARANRVVVRESRGEVVSVIEVVSPGNKSSVSALRSFVNKSAGLLGQGINLLVIDLFPPSARDPQGIHGAVWDEIGDGAFELPADKPLTLAAYSAGTAVAAWVEPVAVGDSLRDTPAFLDPDTYVPVPLESSYQATWAACPEEFRDAVAGGPG